MYHFPPFRGLVHVFTRQILTVRLQSVLILEQEATLSAELTKQNALNISKYILDLRVLCRFYQIAEI